MKKIAFSIFIFSSIISSIAMEVHNILESREETIDQITNKMNSKLESIKKQVDTTYNNATEYKNALDSMIECCRFIFRQGISNPHYHDIIPRAQMFFVNFSLKKIIHESSNSSCIARISPLLVLQEEISQWEQQGYTFSQRQKEKINQAFQYMRLPDIPLENDTKSNSCVSFFYLNNSIKQSRSYSTRTPHVTTTAIPNHVDKADYFSSSIEHLKIIDLTAEARNDNPIVQHPRSQTSQDYRMSIGFLLNK